MTTTAPPPARRRPTAAAATATARRWRWAPRRRRERGGLSLFLAPIQFCDALLPTVDRSHLIHHAHLLSVDLVDLAGAYPHVSGFYKLVRIVVDVCETCGYFDGGGGDGGSGGGSGALVAASADAERCYSLLGGFLRALLERVQRFKDELLAAAMQLLLRAPRRFVGGEAMRWCGATRCRWVTLAAATAALDALERWLAHAELYADPAPAPPRASPNPPRLPRAVGQGERPRRRRARRPRRRSGDKGGAPRQSSRVGVGGARASYRGRRAAAEDRAAVGPRRR